jgi:MFS family permease
VEERAASAGIVVTSALSRIGAITAGTTVLQAGNGLLQALIPLRMSAAGMPVSAIGLVATAYGVGFVSGCLLVPALVRRIGHIRAFASLAAISAVVVLLFTQARSVVDWALLRAVSGLALAGLFTVADSWISVRAKAADRGRLISVYMLATKVALMLSPLCVGLGEITRDGLFMASSALICLSLLPLASTISEEPQLPGSLRPNIRALSRVAPSAVVGAFAVGLINGPVLALAPVFGVSIGLSPELAAALLFALQGGGLVLQWPLGWLSDRMDRRIVIAGMAFGTALVSALVAWAGASGSPLAVIIACALWGGLGLCIYATCVAHASDLVDATSIVPTISSLLISWAVGTIIGPVIAAPLMDRVGPYGLFIYAGIVALLLAMFVALRISMRTRSPGPRGFIDLAPSSPATASLGRQAGDA